MEADDNGCTARWSDDSLNAKDNLEVLPVIGRVWRLHPRLPRPDLGGSGSSAEW